MPGPAAPSLQDAYGLSYAGAALHLTTSFVGSGVTSALDSRLSTRFEHAVLLQAALVGTAVGAVISGVAPNAVVSEAGITVMGFCGTVAVNIAHGVLGSEHGDDGARRSSTRTCSPLSDWCWQHCRWLRHGGSACGDWRS